MKSTIDIELIPLDVPLSVGLKIGDMEAYVGTKHLSKEILTLVCDRFMTDTLECAGYLPDIPAKKVDVQKDTPSHSNLPDPELIAKGLHSQSNLTWTLSHRLQQAIAHIEELELGLERDSEE